MKVYYRISDKGNPKPKLPQADKFSCLRNAAQQFGAENMHVIADNCNPETIAFLEANSFQYEETALGNSPSFMYMIEKIIATHHEDEIVYLLEDDYIHLPHSRQCLQEGLKIADYVTLYDHPDKYLLAGDSGNPLNYKKLHRSRLFVTQKTHWRQTNSTTMTFACTVKTLAEDYPVWKKYTVTRNPKDFHAFLRLGQNHFVDAWHMLLQRKHTDFFIILKNWLTRRRMRLIISAVPAKATHAELKWLAPCVDWENMV